MDVSASRTPEVNLKIAGLARLTDWKEFEGEGFFSFVQESSPPLGFQFEAQFDESNFEFAVSVVEEYLQDWVVLLSDTLLLESKENARRLLLDEVNIDLDSLDALLIDWNDQEELLDVTLEQLAAQNVILNESISEWTERATGGILSPLELFEGLRPLF